MKWLAAVLAAWLCLALSGGFGPAAAQPAREDGVGALLDRVELVMLGGDPDAYLALLSTYADRDLAREAASQLVARTMTRAVLRERDRAPLDGTLPGDGYRLMVEAFIEYGDRGRLATWRFDVRRVSDGERADSWAIAAQQQVTVVDGLYRLSLDATKQFRVQDLTFGSEDLQFTVPEGRLFVSETQEGRTAAVLLAGPGSTFTFAPAPETEREQLRLFTNAETITDGFGELFMRFDASDFEVLFPPASTRLQAVDAAAVRRADAVFRDEVGRSFGLDVGDFSRDTWSLSPNAGDLLVEIRTARYQTLTYAKSSNEPEDISVFDRRRRKNISVYSSKARTAERGRFFDEDAVAAYDTTDYLVEARFDPERNAIVGRTRLRLRVRNTTNNITLKLAESLAVRSVFSQDFGRLLSIRVRNQNAVVVNLPFAAAAGMEFSLLVEYGGTLPPTRADREAAGVSAQQDPFTYDALSLPGEASWLYTTRSYWYPQSPVSDYAPALLRLTVPEGFGVLASGELMAGFPIGVAPPDGRRGRDLQFVFTAAQPLRYLSCLISKLVRVVTKTIPLEHDLSADRPDGTRQLTRPVRPGVFYDALSLSIDTNPRLRARGVRMAPVAEDVIRFYAGLVGDSPYPSLAVGLIERDLPGGHSPAYLNVIHHPMPQTTFTWANDPAAFPNYPEFFVAHEIAHQWWGQAVGWRSYHEQWISEGFAQYFAALYAKRRHGDQAFDDVMRRMARFARDQSSQGPISLGYRLGHVRNDQRVFRALVYNKAAVVLHNLRTLLGDDVFFKGVRRFYFDWRFRKAGTDDVRRAFEAESGSDLTGFFEHWIRTSRIPSLRFGWRREEGPDGPLAVIRFEAVSEAVDVAVPVTLRFSDRTTRLVAVPIRQGTAELRLPVAGDLRDVTVNDGGLALVDIVRQ